MTQNFHVGSLEDTPFWALMCWLHMQRKFEPCYFNCPVRERLKIEELNKETKDG